MTTDVVVLATSDNCDVVVLATFVDSQLAITGLWNVCGTGQNQRVLPAHVYAKQLATEKAFTPYPCFMHLQASILTYFNGRG